jgi:4-amino-4-deoxy-L-arabinose transferase-like glycosyltransferase
MKKQLLKLWKRDNFFLGLILILFLGTRLFKIAEVPASVYWDEASIGYNAYSITTDLRDEWGEFLPLHFRAFGEFKLPVYIYATTLAVKLWGLNAFTVRLPAVLFSFGTLILTYLLVLKLTKEKLVSLLAVFYLAVSPWFFIFSRAGYEATAGVFFLVLGIYSYLLSFEKKYLFLFSVMSYVLAIYSYNSLRIIAPLFLLAQTLYSYKTHRKFVFISLIIFGVSLIPIIRLFYYDYGASRFTAVGEKAPVQIVGNYFSHFYPEFLLQGDKNPRSTQPGYGVVWPLDLILVPVGIYAGFKTRKKLFYLFLLGLFTAPIPASLTREAPHALRTLSAVPFLAIYWALGVKFLTDKFKRYREVILAGAVIISLLFFEGYLETFFKTYNAKTAQDWQFNYKKIFLEKKNDFAQADKVVISDAEAQPYIFALFYLQYDPHKFRETVVYNPPSEWGFSTVASFGNFEFVK